MYIIASLQYGNSECAQPASYRYPSEVEVTRLISTRRVSSPVSSRVGWWTFTRPGDKYRSYRLSQSDIFPSAVPCWSRFNVKAYLSDPQLRVDVTALVAQQWWSTDSRHSWSTWPTGKYEVPWGYLHHVTRSGQIKSKSHWLKILLILGKWHHRCS